MTKHCTLHYCYCGRGLSVDPLSGPAWPEPRPGGGAGVQPRPRQQLQLLIRHQVHPEPGGEVLRSAPAATLSSHYNVISAEIFSKRCQTVFAKEASSVVVEHCYQPVTRQCLDSLQPEDGDQVAGGTFCKVSTQLIFQISLQ